MAQMPVRVEREVVTVVWVCVRERRLVGEQMCRVGVARGNREVGTYDGRTTGGQSGGGVWTEETGAPA